MIKVGQIYRRDKVSGFVVIVRELRTGIQPYKRYPGFALFILDENGVRVRRSGMRSPNFARFRSEHTLIGNNYKERS